MRKAVSMVSVFLLLAAALTFAGSAEAAVITIKNATGGDLYEIYISDSGTEDWEEDVLGRDILEDGETLSLTVNGSYKQFDMAAVDGEGTSVAWLRLPGSVRSITIYADGTAEYR